MERFCCFRLLLSVPCRVRNSEIIVIVCSCVAAVLSLNADNTQSQLSCRQPNQTGDRAATGKHLCCTVKYCTALYSMEGEGREEQEEKARLITQVVAGVRNGLVGLDRHETLITEQVLELQNTLEELSSRVDGVKEENMRLRSENQVRLA